MAIIQTQIQKVQAVRWIGSLAVVSVCLLAASFGCKRQQTSHPTLRLGVAANRAPARRATPGRTLPTRRRPTKRSINARFLKPGITAKSWKKRFESQKREVFVARQAIVKLLGIKPGQVVADLGAGTGVHVPALLEAVGKRGTVYAVELAPIFIKHLKKLAKNKGYTNLKVRKSTPNANSLPTKGVDLIFVCATYHHFERPVPMLQDIRRALRPGGRLAIVDFRRIPGVSSKWLLNHVKKNQKQVIAQILKNGFVLEKDVNMSALKENYFVIFKRKK